MIKSISLLSRREGWSHDAFVHEWVHVHAGTPQAFGDLIAKDGRLWAEVIKKAGIQLQ